MDKLLRSQHAKWRKSQMSEQQKRLHFPPTVFKDSKFMTNSSIADTRASESIVWESKGRGKKTYLVTTDIDNLYDIDKAISVT